MWVDETRKKIMGEVGWTYYTINILIFHNKHFYSGSYSRLHIPPWGQTCVILFIALYKSHSCHFLMESLDFLGRDDDDYHDIITIRVLTANILRSEYSKKRISSRQGKRIMTMMMITKDRKFSLLFWRCTNALPLYQKSHNQKRIYIFLK